MTYIEQSHTIQVFILNETMPTKYFADFAEYFADFADFGDFAGQRINPRAETGRVYLQRISQNLAILIWSYWRNSENGTSQHERENFLTWKKISD